MKEINIKIYHEGLLNDLEALAQEKNTTIQEILLAAFCITPQPWRR